jgi:hypothetical protein
MRIFTDPCKELAEPRLKNTGLERGPKKGEENGERKKIRKKGRRYRRKSDTGRIYRTKKIR